MNSLQFKKNQLKSLAATLKCSTQDILLVLENINECYYEYQKYKKDKEGRVITYLDGVPKKRVITPSFGILKRIQSSIKRNILDRVKVPVHIEGGVKGKSNISNGKSHQGKKYQFTTDLQNFFPSIKNSLIYSFFLKLGYSNLQANWLTKLTTYKHGLPQGAPTSPQLSNFCFIEIDEKLLEITKQNDITYTRYIDDLTFSSPKDFQAITNELLAVITDNGFNLSYRKTSYSGNQTITGIKVFNNFIDAPQSIKKKAEDEKQMTSTSKPYTVYLTRIQQTNKKK